MDTINYYTSEIFEVHGDPFVSELFLIGRPITLAVLLIAIVTGMKYFQTSMSNRKAYDMRPIKLIYSGLWFGVNGAGFMMGLAATNGGSDAFECVPRTQLDIPKISIRYLGYVYLITLLFDMFYSTFLMAEKKAVSIWNLASQAAWIFTVTVCYSFYPAGFFAFCPMVHCFLRIFKYAIEVMDNSSLEMQSSNTSKNLFLIATIVAWIAMAAQQFAFYGVPNCGFDKFLPGLMSSFAATMAVGLIANANSMWARSKPTKLTKSG